MKKERLGFPQKVQKQESCQVMFSQTSTQLTNQFINVSNLKFGSTSECNYEIDLHIASIKVPFLGAIEIPFLKIKSDPFVIGPFI